MMDPEHMGLLAAVKSKIDELDALIKHGMSEPKGPPEKPGQVEGSPAEEAQETPEEEAKEPMMDEDHPGKPGLMILLGHTRKPKKDNPGEGY